MGLLRGLLKGFAAGFGGETIHQGYGRYRLPRTWWKIEGALPLARGGSLPVVGESHYQETFARVIGARYVEGVYWHVMAQLAFVTDNPHDPNAIAVLIDRQLAGYIPADLAPAMREAILAINPAELPVVCLGEITGGFTRGKQRGSYGLTLDIAEPLAVKVR